MKRILLLAFLLFIAGITNAQLISVEFEEYYVDDTACPEPETPATLECQSCGYYELDSFGEYTVWNAGSPSNQIDFQHKVLDWDGGNAFSAPNGSPDQDLIFDCYEMGAIVDESVPTKNRSGGVINFNGVNNDAVLIASTSCQDPQGSMYTKLTDVDFTGNLPDNNQFWDPNPGDVIRKCIKTCALSTSLPQYPVGGNGSTTFSPQRWDFAISRSQNNTNNIINPTVTEGDRRFVFRYHSGRAKAQFESDDGFDNIIFEYKEWIYTTSWPYPNTPTDTSNWFGMGGDGGGWMEVDGYDSSGTPQTPEFPVPAGECRLCYGYNEIQFPLSITTWETNYNINNASSMKSFYEVTHGVCVGGEPDYDPGYGEPNPLYIDGCFDYGGCGENGVAGCTNPTACNFDSNATCNPNNACLDLDSCGDCGGSGIAGCTDDTACNFDPNATCDPNDACLDFDVCGNCCGSGIAGCTDEAACNFDPTATCDPNDACLELDSCGDCGGSGIAGCTDDTACNFDPTATCDPNDDCLELDSCGDCGGSGIVGCTDNTACNFDPAATCNPNDDCLELDSCGDCGGSGIAGCTDNTACNFDPAATCNPNDDCLELDVCGDCGGSGIAGCTDDTACNFDPAALCDDDSCQYVLVYDVNGSLTPGLFESEAYLYYETEGSTFEWVCTGGVIISGNGSSQIEVTWVEQGIGELCVVETNSEGCVGEQFCIDVAVIPTNIGEEEQVNISLFPNPASTSFTISADDRFINTTYRLFDSQGKLVLQGTISANSTLVQTNDFSSGKYTLSISNGEQIVTETIFLQE